jgi:hypothetical protein
MTRSHGRCPKGERRRVGYPHSHRKTTTLVAGLRMTGMVAQMVLDGPINGDWFEAYVAQVLVPQLRPGDVVIMMTYRATNAPRCANGSRMRARHCVSCPTAPTSTPSKKPSPASRPCSAISANEPVSGLWDQIGMLVDIFLPNECANYFSSCGYDPE